MVASRQIALRGIEASQRGDSASAEMYFSSAIQACPEHDRAHAGYADVLWKRGARDLAIGHMEQAVRLSGGDPDLLVRLGRMHLEQGEHEAAIHRAEQAIRSNRELATAWLLQGDILRERAELDPALASYYRALSLQEHCCEAQLAVADIYLAQGRPQRALATLESLASRFGTGQIPAEVHRRQGVAQKALGRFDEAARSFVAAGLPGTSSEWAGELAEAQLLAGELSAARLTVAEGMRHAPDNPKLTRIASEIDRQQQRMAVRTSRDSS
jgi:tetratricopeptide (TPR) repeat protein